MHRERSSARTPPAITDRDWVLASLGERADPAGAGGRAPTLRLDASTSRASGFAACNRFTTTYVLSGERLTFGPVASTRMACAEGMEVERSFLSALGAVESYEVGDGTLVLKGTAGPLARLRADSREANERFLEALP